jgi:hypothetical protein
VNVQLLAADNVELEELGLAPVEAFERGVLELGRQDADRPQEEPATEAATHELVHLYARVAADVRQLRFEYATKAAEYERSRREYDDLERALAGLGREVVPAGRARLDALRRRESGLERELAARGIDGSAIGPHVPPGTAIDPTPRPGEGEPQPRILPRLSGRPTIGECLRRRLRRR